MDLESRVKAYAEEARRILLQRALEEKEQKNGKAFWQGYTTNGNGIVKQDGIYKVVQVIGNVSVPKNTVVYIDEKNTVEVGFKRELPPAKSYSKQQLAPTIADKIKRPLLIFTDDIFGVGDFVLSYGYLRYNYSTSNNYAEIYADITGNVTGSDSTTLINVTNIYSSKNTYYFGGAGAFCSTNGFILGGITYTSSVDLTGTPWDFSISATVDTFSQDSEYYATTAFGVLSSNITAVVDYQAEGAYSGGSIDYEVDFSYFTPPETDFYLQHGNLGPDADDPIYKRLDLQSYFSDTIVDYELYHNYTKKTEVEGDTTSSQTFLIFYVQTVDFSFSQIFTEAPADRDASPWEARAAGALKHWYLHIKINHDNNSVDYKVTLQTKMTTGSNYNYATSFTEFDDAYQGENVFARIETYRFDTAGSRYRVTVDVDDQSNYPLNRHPHLQDILSEAYEGDWLYDWRNIIVPDLGGASVPPDFYYYRFFDFLKYHFYEGVWYDHLNSGELREPPYIGSSVGSWQPGSQYQNDYGIGIPPDTTGYSINNLVIAMENFATYTNYSDYFDGSVQGVPDVYDEWVTGTYGPQPPFTSVISNQERPWFTYVQTIPLQP